MPQLYTLDELGWTEWYQQQIPNGILTFNGNVVPWSHDWEPARISADYGVEYEVFSNVHDSDRVVLAGPMRRARFDNIDRPAVGDWVAIERHQHLVGRFRRQTTFVRKAAGEEFKPQMLAANVDLVFIVTSLNREFNVRRLERYLTAVVESGAKPVVVLNKADLVASISPYFQQVSRLRSDLDVVAISSLNDLNSALNHLEIYLKRGQTIALVGSSGVGKSTLTNLLLDEPLLRTAEIRGSDDEGRHTTTHREMVVLPDDRGLLIDTPGMREFGLWSEEEALDDTFDEIADAARQCRFRDCRHESEPGCAVREEIAAGRIDGARLRSWRTLQQELEEKEERRNRRGRKSNK